MLARMLAGVLIVGLLGALAQAEEPVSLMDAKAKNLGWNFGLSTEFPGGAGSLSVDTSVQYEGKDTLKLEADFSKGGGYAQAGQTIRQEVDVRELSFRMKDPDSEGLTLRLIDGSAQVHQIKLRKPKSADWQQVVFPLEEFFAKKGTAEALPNVTAYEKWGGPNDGKWHGPIKVIYILATKTEATTRTLWLADVSIVPRPETVKAVVRLDEFPGDKVGWEFLPGIEFPGAKGSLELAKDLPEQEKPGLKLAGDFTEGGGYVGALKELNLHIAAVRLQYKTDDVGMVTVRFADSTEQVHQRTRVPLQADGKWHELVLRPYAIVGGEHWGGANDKQWHSPAKWFSILVPSYAKPNTKQFALYLADIRAEIEPGAEAAPVPAPAPAAEEAGSLPVTLLSVQPATITARPEYGFDITYRWKADKPLPKDYTVFVHFVDQEGKTVLQDDHAPPTPTSQWNGAVEYKHTVFLTSWTPRGAESFPGPTEGKYAIYVGLMDDRGRKTLTAGEGVTADNANRYQIGTLVLDKNAPLPELGPKTLDMTGYAMTWSDEFDDLSVSAKGPCGPSGTRWSAHTPFGGDFGDARFTDPTPDFPFTVKDGILQIEVRKIGNRWHGGLLASVDPQGNGFSQKFGYFEMRAKLPKGPGTWPAFWIHTLDRVTRAADKSLTFIEIDILEQYGHWPSKLTTAIHQWRRDNQPSIHDGGRFLVSGMADDFHTYGCMVTEEFITFYFDGVELRRDKTPECGKVPLYVMVNLTCGPGWPLDKTPDPSYMYVDYVRVYAKK